MALSILLVCTTPALAAIGNQPATEWCLQGDIQSEKELEGQLFTIFGLGAAAGVVTGGPFAGMVLLGLGKIADPQNATWENWPEDRYMFHHAPPEKFLDIGVVAEKALYSTIEFVANMIFSATKTLVRTSNNIVVLAFHTDIISVMVGWVSDGLLEIFSPSGDLTQLLITIGLILLLIYSIFRFLRGQAMAVLTSVIIAVVAVGGVFFFTANARQIIAKTAEATDSLAGVFLSAVGKYTSAGQNVNLDSPMDRGVVAAGQTAWQLMVARPWALGQFGAFDENRLKLTQSEYDILDKKSFPKESQGKIQAGMRLDTLMLGSGPEGRDAVAEALGRPNKKFLWIFNGKDVDHGEHNGTMNGFAPTAAFTHLKIAGLTLLPAIGYALLATLVALSIVLSQVVLAGLMIILPLPLLAAMVPETGWAFSTKYARITLSYFMVKLVYGLYMSLVLAIGTGFANGLMKYNLGGAMLLLTALFGAAALYRKKFLSFVLDSVHKSATGYGDRISESTRRIIENNTILARKLGLTDVLTDWWFSRKKGSPGGGSTTPGSGDITVFIKRWKALPPGSQDKENGYGTAWEGNPPDGAPFKELPPARAEDVVPRDQGSGPPPDGNKQPDRDGPGGFLDTTRAIPRGIARTSPSTPPAGEVHVIGQTGAVTSGAGAGITGGAGAGGTAGGSAAAAAGGVVAVGAVVGAAVVSGAKKFTEGEVKATVEPSAPDRISAGAEPSGPRVLNHNSEKQTSHGAEPLMPDRVEVTQAPKTKVSDVSYKKSVTPVLRDADVINTREPNFMSKIHKPSIPSGNKRRKSWPPLPRRR